MADPDVLKHEKVVDYQENWKGRGYDTAVVAAPIKISGEDYIAGVCVKRASGESRFYVHEVLPIKEGATPFNRAALKTSVDSGGDTPSMNNIPSELLHVKGILKSSHNQTEIDSFKKWFGDWKNDPARPIYPLFSADWYRGVDGADFAIQARAATSPIQTPCFLAERECIKNSKIFAGFLAISMLLWYSFL